VSTQIQRSSDLAGCTPKLTLPSTSVYRNVQATPQKGSALVAVITKEGVKDPAVREYVRAEFMTKIHRNLDVLEFIRCVWDFEPVDIPSKPLPTPLHPEAQCYTLPHDTVAAYHLATERACYPHLMTIFKHLQCQLFGESKPKPGTLSEDGALPQVPTRPLEAPRTDEYDEGSRRRGEASGRVLRPLPNRTAGGSNANEHLRYRLKKNRTLDTEFVNMKDSYVNGNYTGIKPDLTFSTTKGRKNQHWSWVMAYGEVKRVISGKAWVHTGDVQIPLYGLKEVRYAARQYSGYAC